MVLCLASEIEYRTKCAELAPDWSQTHDRRAEPSEQNQSVESGMIANAADPEKYSQVRHSDRSFRTHIQPTGDQKILELYTRTASMLSTTNTTQCMDYSLHTDSHEVYLYLHTG